MNFDKETCTLKDVLIRHEKLRSSYSTINPEMYTPTAYAVTESFRDLRVLKPAIENILLKTKVVDVGLLFWY